MYQQQYYNYLSKKHGGHLVFDDNNRLLKINESTYKYLQFSTGNFNESERKDLEYFQNFILPTIENFGIEDSKNLYTINAGGFGVTLGIDHPIPLAIKILKVNTPNIVDEIVKNLYLFRDNNGTEYPNIPEQINHIDGIITGNEKIAKQINAQSQLIRSRHLDLFHNLKNINIRNASDLIKNISVNVPLLENLVILIMCKGNIDVKNYINKQNSSVEWSIMKKFFKDMSLALLYINVTRSAIHLDIKPANIIINYELDLFKLIDFGSLIKLENYYDKSQEEIFNLTPTYYLGTSFVGNMNILYDWHCLYLTSLQMLKMIDYVDNQYIFIEDELKDIVVNTSNYETYIKFTDKMQRVISTLDIEPEDKRYFYNILSILAFTNILNSSTSNLLRYIDDSGTFLIQDIDSIEQYIEFVVSITG